MSSELSWVRLMHRLVGRQRGQACTAGGACSSTPDTSSRYHSQTASCLLLSHLAVYLFIRVQQPVMPWWKGEDALPPHLLPASPA